MFDSINKAAEVIRAGIWQHGEKLEAAWFDSHNRAHFLSTDIRHPLDIMRKLNERMQSVTANAVKFSFMTAIAPHRIWHKTLILPQRLNEQECRQQCRFILQNELPVGLEELWFDYCSTPLKQGLRLDIFAIMQNVARAHLAALSPLHIEVLDNAAHCILRAFHYLLPQPQSATLFLYQDEEGCLALQDKPHRLQLLHKTTQNPTALFRQYCEHYKETPSQVAIYSAVELHEALPPEWRRVRQTGQNRNNAAESAVKKTHVFLPHFLFRRICSQLGRAAVNTEDI